MKATKRLSGDQVGREAPSVPGAVALQPNRDARTNNWFPRSLPATNARCRPLGEMRDVSWTAWERIPVRWLNGEHHCVRNRRGRESCLQPIAPSAASVVSAATRHPDPFCVRAVGRGCVEERGITGSERIQGRTAHRRCHAGAASDPWRGSAAAVPARAGAPSPAGRPVGLALEDRGRMSVSVARRTRDVRSASRRARSRTPRCRCACRPAVPRACSGAHVGGRSQNDALSRDVA